MMLANYFLNSPICFEDGKVNVLVIEERCFLRQTISKMIAQQKGDTDDWVLSEDGRILPFSKNVEIITDLWNLDGGSRRIFSQIAKDAIETGKGMPAESRKVLEAINFFAETLLLELDYNATYETIQIIDPIIKMLGIKVDFDNLDFSERILEYLRICRRFLGTKLFVVFGLRDLLASQERKKLYEMMAYEKIQVLLIESHIDDADLKYECVRIIDEHLCEL